MSPLQLAGAVALMVLAFVVFFGAVALAVNWAMGPLPGEKRRRSR